ncbi:GAF and ANTAR domain-containing protein [Amycolatopsis sp. SID8362]|uniref:GAF and ANTAR domain-containing protein n=1 Tax=Amycolatopsis sp. SID8362 TaxID=2690346 RepID=UPI00136A11F9|nr:GAF and ANTAR domain-containing protein [Amycolatopsis sp. SID8362]NBH09912.1 GAF domain-containing protein [Amycolatopsis sp. SID8362]NED46605.1 GAF and ANTAR domain-containing protein [Amycolatopsis sp. SID8362]
MSLGEAPSGELPLDDELAVVAARMSGLLLSRETVDSVLDLIVSLAGSTIRAAAGAGVTLVDDAGGLATTSASAPLVSAADTLQYDLGEGPCIAALHECAPVRIDDVTTERRWPRWCAAAAGAGLRSVLTAPMTTADGCHGAIKVYATVPGAFGPVDERALMTFAERAAVLVANARACARASRYSDRFKDTLRDRDRVTMAKGFLMGRDGLDEDAAFDRLLALARARGRTPAETAAELVAPAPEG